MYLNEENSTKNRMKYIMQIIGVTIIIWYLMQKGIIGFVFENPSDNDELYWNLINLNSILAGFMFTSLGVIMSLSDSEFIKKIEATNILDRMYSNIIKGVVSSLISLIMSLIIVFGSEKMFTLLEVFSGLASVVFLVPIFLALVSFLVSIADVRKLIKAIRKYAKKDTMSRERRLAAYNSIENESDNRKED